jgi:hypothetical protein
MASVGILGIILGGWASNSHYPLLGALRSAAQLVSYEVAMAVALVSGVLAAGSLSLVTIIRAQEERQIWFAFANYGAMLVPFFHLSDRRDRRNESNTIRSSGGRIGTYWRLSHRILRISLGALYVGRVCQHLRHFLRRSSAVSRRMVAAVSQCRLAGHSLELQLFRQSPSAGQGLFCFPMSAKVPGRIPKLGLRVVGRDSCVAGRSISHTLT